VSRSSSDAGLAEAVERALQAPPLERRGRNAAGSPTVAIGSQLARLTRISADGHRVVSCYLKLEPRDRVRGKYLTKLKNRAKAVEGALPRLGLPHAVHEAALRDIGRVVEYLRNPANLPPVHGVAVFASEAIDLFEAIPLPVVHRSRLAVERTPLVRELVSIDDEFGYLLTAVLDRTGARLFEVTAWEAVEILGLRADSTRGGRFRGDQNGPGWGEHNYHNRIREEKHRHNDAIARELFELDRRRPARGIILAGTGNEARGVEPFLHSYLAERLLGTTKLNPKDVNPGAVHAASLQVRQEWERQKERTLVAELRERLGERWAVNGLDATLRALARGQMRTLLVNNDTAVPGFRCEGSGLLALNERDCRAEGNPIPVLDVVDDAIEEALRQGVDVNVVYDPDAVAAIDGIAGLLRWRG
jgi:peptide subunit release factor 1 (eRF1)